MDATPSIVGECGKEAGIGRPGPYVGFTGRKDKPIGDPALEEVVGARGAKEVVMGARGTRERAFFYPLKKLYPRLPQTP